MKKINQSFKINLSKPPNIDFLKSLTNQTGVLQHTKYGVPHRSFGYSLDDNARALIVVIRAYRLFGSKEYLDLAKIYLSFIIHAKEAGDFYKNFQTFDHQFLPRVSQDSFGETLWALAEVIESKADRSLTNLAKELFSGSEKNINNVTSPRAVAYTIIALSQILKTNPKNKAVSTNINKLTSRLLKLYEKYKDQNWIWFEPVITYANHILPAALFYSYLVEKNKLVLEAAKSALSFIEEQTHTKEGIPSPVGSYGWFEKGKEKATFDQQPVEASYAVVANLAAYRVTQKEKYKEAAIDWFNWFHGNNIKKSKIYNQKTGACFDGLHSRGPNLNQGAESTICYLLAYLDLAASISPKR